MNINLANIDFCPGGKSATLTETTAEILLTETQKIIVPPEGTDGFNKVTITHAPVEESVSATITENGTHTITPSEGFGAMVGVNVDVNIPSVTDDKIQYFYKKPTADDAGLKEIGWTDDDVNYYKYNNYAYPWEVDKYKVSDTNKQIVINNKSDIETYKSNPDFQYCPMFDTSAETDMDGTFQRCKYIRSIPQLNTQSATKMSFMFYDCPKLTNIPQLDTRRVTGMSDMFNNCPSLTSIPQLDTSKVTDMSFMFVGCSSLTTIPQLNTQSVTNMNSMFDGCESLISVPLFDTSKVTRMGEMFRDCKLLTSIPQLNTQSATDMNSMFKGCSSLTTIPQLNTQSATKISTMFSECKALTTIPQLDTSKVTDMSYMFYYCASLVSVPKLDATSLTNTSKMFGYDWSALDKFTTFGGMTNLKIDLDLSPCIALTHDSLINVINEAADVTASPKTLTLGDTNLNKLTDEDKAIATNKGWVLA